MKYMACLVMLLTAFTACSPDSDASDPGSTTNKTYTLHFNLSPVSGSSASSRAETYTAGKPNTWEDGSKEENMKSWTVVFVKSDGTVAKVVKKPSVEEGKDKKDDVIVTGLEAGTDYTVYSFANISDTELGKLGTITEGSPSPDFDSKTFAVNGNDMDITKNGIPMSNKQTVTIGPDGQPDVKQLYVVRMLSKITLKFRNMTGGDITVKTVSISDITSNPATGTNIMLLPKTSASSTNVAQTPNLVENAKRDDFTHTIGLTVDKNATDYDTGNSRSVSFYVNESKAGNAYPYFVVTIETNVGSQRYFMYTDWNQIARNDHHVLKLALSDYKLRFKVEDFSAIGMYPSVKDDGKQLNLTFHYPGEEFHIIPSVTKYSDPTGAEVSFTNLEWKKLSESETGAESKAFSTIPKMVTGENRIEAETLGELGKKTGPIIYQLSVKVNDGTTTAPTLVYRVAISQDLTWYSARRHNGAFWICKQ